VGAAIAVATGEVQAQVGDMAPAGEGRREDGGHHGAVETACRAGDRERNDEAIGEGTRGVDLGEDGGSAVAAAVEEEEAAAGGVWLLAAEDDIHGEAAAPDEGGATGPKGSLGRGGVDTGDIAFGEPEGLETPVAV